MNYLLALFFAHWVGDFVCQTRYIADNKSKKTLILLLHVTIYMAVMSGVALSLCFYHTQRASWNAMFYHWFQWTVLNFALHFCTDAITSRLTGYWYRSGNIKAFFTTVGFDQFLHAASLLLTAKMLFPWL